MPDLLANEPVRQETSALQHNCQDDPPMELCSMA
jgi:hypothetical protein